jgi:cyclase
MCEEYSSKHFTLEQVGEGVYAAIAKEGGGAVGNAGFIDLGDQSIIFDTFNTPQAGEDLKNITEKITNRPVSWAINSHWHGDHIRGNQAFKKSLVISSETTYQKMKEIHPSRILKQKRDIKGLTNYIHSLKEEMSKNNDRKRELQISFLSEIEQSLPTLELVLPHVTFKNKMTFYGSKRSAKLFTLGRGHSDCDAVLYLPEDKVIFMGDLLFVQSHPSIFAESDPENWTDILKRVGRMDIQTSIPGHGPLGTKNSLLEIIEYLEHLNEAARKCEDIDKIEIPAKYQNWSSGDLYQTNIKRLLE